MVVIFAVDLQQLLPIGRIELQGPLRCEIDFPGTSQRGIDDDGIAGVKFSVAVQIQFFIVGQCRNYVSEDNLSDSLDIILGVIRCCIGVARGRCGDLCVVQVHFPGAQVPLALAVQGLDHDGGKRASRDKIRHKAAVLGDGQLIGSVDSVGRKAQAAQIPAPYILGRLQIKGIRNKLLHQLPGIVAPEDHIAAVIAGEPAGGIKHRLLDRLRQRADALRLPGDGLGDAGAHVADLYGAIAVLKHIEHGLDHLGGGVDAHLCKGDRKRIAKINLLPVQLGIGQAQRHPRHAHIVVGNVVLRRGAQLVRRRLPIKYGGQVQGQDAHKVVGARGLHDLLRQLHGYVLARPVGIDGGVDGGAVGVLLHGRQVFAVADGNAPVLPSAAPEFHCKAVELVLPAENIQDAAPDAAQERADRIGHRGGHAGGAGLICPKGKAAILWNGLFGDGIKHTLHARGRKWRHHNAGKIVADVPGVHRDQASQGARDAVDPEGLRIAVRLRLC